MNRPIECSLLNFYNPKFDGKLSLFATTKTQDNEMFFHVFSIAQNVRDVCEYIKNYHFRAMDFCGGGDKLAHADVATKCEDSYHYLHQIDVDPEQDRQGKHLGLNMMCGLAQVLRRQREVRGWSLKPAIGFYKTLGAKMFGDNKQEFAIDLGSKKLKTTQFIKDDTASHELTEYLNDNRTERGLWL